MKKFRELYVGLFFLAFSGFIYALSFQIQMTKADPVGPQFFPQLIALLIGVLAIVSIVRSLNRLREQNKQPIKAEVNAEAITKTEATGNKLNYSFYFTIISLIAYMLFIESVGFILLSIIYLFIQIYLVSPKEDKQKRNMIINGIVSVVVPISLYYLFYHAFGIFLPEGILG